MSTKTNVPLICTNCGFEISEGQIICRAGSVGEWVVHYYCPEDSERPLTDEDPNATFDYAKVIMGF